MKIEKYCLVLVIVAGILCVPAFGQLKHPFTEDKPVLIGRANRTLKGIDKLYVSITQLGAEPDKDGLVLKKLEAEVKNKLNKNGIKISPGPAAFTFDTPMLRVDINMLKLVNSQQYVFYIQTSLARAVRLAEGAPWSIKVDVWKSEPKMEAVSAEAMTAAVTDSVTEQIEAFINAYLVANMNGVQAADANEPATVTPPKRPKQPLKSKVAKNKYVASKNSKVFHRANCNWAERIKRQNLIGYNSRAEAVKAGNRPCKQCEP